MPERAADVSPERLQAGHFYAPCPGAGVPRSPGEGARGDAVEDRPASSRRHPDRAESSAARARGRSPAAGGCGVDGPSDAGPGAFGGVRAAVSARGAALLAGLALAWVPAPCAAEVCRYAGDTDHAGHVAVRTEVRATGGAITVDVALVLTARALFSDIRYLAQEISTWRGGELQGVAVNARTTVDGRVRRQQWDVFARGPAGFEARRVQAKTEADFRRRHPGFVQHWDPASFGRPWLQDYAAAAPERRPDLDLPLGAAPPGLRTPLALAFYWSRWPLPGGGGVPVFLPGFKRDARAEAAATAAAPGEGWRSWQATLRHPGLTGAVPSTAQAWVSPDGYLLQLAFDVSARQGSARGLLRSQGCEGIQVAPTDRAR